MLQEGEVKIHTETEAREKNIDEYNKTADKYEEWSKENILM